MTEELVEHTGFTPEVLVTLGEAGVKTIDDLGDLASDELIEILPDTGLTMEQANEIIMAARAHWFDDEEADAEADGDADEGDGASGEPS